MTDHPQRRFPPPWDIDDNGACFIVRDANGQALSHIYYETEPARRAAAIYSRATRLVCRVRHSTGSRNHSDCVNSATAFANCVAEHAMPVRRSGFPTELIPITAVISPI
jgi:hypothetical protein